MFDGFERRQIQVGDVAINLVVAGDGPPLLLLHGYPQTHVMWHKVAPSLAARFTVVATDLRGYGDSSTPETTDDHATYSKRVTADDQVAVMDALGFHRFHLAGHDRGGRVGHRLALDHPDRVRSLTVLDIAPTYTMYTTTDMTFAEAYYHWFFLIQPYDLPERLIGNDPEYFLRRKFAQWGRDDTAFTAEAMAEYVRCFTPATIHASCEDYRASAAIDLSHDQADLDAGYRLSCPVLALWGVNGFVGRNYDVIEEWRVWADDVRGSALASGHFVPEEAPGETLDALFGFCIDDG
ncbi:alpha/beta hydrolase [soil metagenome]